MEGIDEIRRLRRACEDMELENRELLAKYTDEQLSDMFNGIGPQGFPGWLRAALDESIKKILAHWTQRILMEQSSMRRAIGR